jgi:hypothetical protein
MKHLEPWPFKSWWSWFWFAVACLLLYIAKNYG